VVDAIDAAVQATDHLPHRFVLVLSQRGVEDLPGGGSEERVPRAAVQLVGADAIENPQELRGDAQCPPAQDDLDGPGPGTRAGGGGTVSRSANRFWNKGLTKPPAESASRTASTQAAMNQNDLT